MNISAPQSAAATDAAAAAVDSRRLDSVQILRGLAAMAVVFNHAAVFLAYDDALALGRSWLAPTYDVGVFGSIGVDLFFVISGFVMAFSARRFVGVRGAATFLALRYVRIAPLFYLCAGVILVDLLRAGARIDPQSLYNTFTFIPIFDDDDYSWPVHYLGWTLAFEFVFYLFVAAMVAAGFGNRPSTLLVILVLLPFGGMVFDAGPIVWRIFTNPMLWEFALGVVAYLLWDSGRLARWRRASAFAFAVAALAIAAALWLLPEPFTGHAGDTVAGTDATRRVLFWGVPMFLLFCAVVGAPAVGHGRLADLGRLLGDASYSIYLTHLAVVRVLSEILERVPIPPDLAIVTCLVLSAMLGVLTFRWLEQPMLTRGQRLVRRSTCW